MVSGHRQGDKDIDGQDKVRTLQKALNKAGITLEVVVSLMENHSGSESSKANSLAITPQGEIDAATGCVTQCSYSPGALGNSLRAILQVPPKQQY